MKDHLIVVAGGGGFIGGHLVADLLRRGFTNIRSVDIKPFDQWYQQFGEVENLQLDLQEKDSCTTACNGAAEIYQHVADVMEGARAPAPGAARGRGSTGSRRGGTAIEIPQDPKALGKLITQLENRMFEHAKNLEFEEAAQVRDQIQEIRRQELLGA